MNRRSFHKLTLGAGASLTSSFLAAADSAPAPGNVRIGQIGTGHAHAGAQFAALRKCPGFEVVGVVEPDEARRKRAETKADYEGVKWMTEEELLNSPGLQAVSVETEVSGLLEHAQKVADAGLHLHLDKPAGESLPKFRQIIKTLGEKKRLLKMGYMFRFNPGFEFLFHAAREGWLGDIFSVDAAMSKVLSDGERKSMLRYGGGSMFELGCHIIDATLLLMGKPDRVIPYIRKSREDGLPDNMMAVLEYPQATVTLRSAFIEVEGGPRRQFVACGTKGTCDIRPLEAPEVKFALSKPVESFHKGYQSVPLPKGPRFEADWAAFASAIRGETPWPYTPEHDLAVQETILLASGMSLNA